MSVPPEDTAEIRRRQKSRSLVMAAGLIAFVVLVYCITIVRMSGS